MPHHFHPDTEKVPLATLLVGTNSTKCNNCGKGVLPDAKTHETVVGYGVEPGNTDGCGVEFTHIISTYFGVPCGAVPNWD